MTNDDDPLTDEERGKAKALYDRLGDEIKSISDKHVGTVVTPEHVLANAAFWLKIVQSEYPEMIPMLAVLLEQLELKARKSFQAMSGGGYVN